MPELQNKLELVFYCLKLAISESELKEYDRDIGSQVTNELMVKTILTNEMGDKLNLMVVAIEKDISCLVSIIQDEKVVAHQTFNYAKDLSILNSIQVPIRTEDLQIDDQILDVILDRLKLQVHSGSLMREKHLEEEHEDNTPPSLKLGSLRTERTSDVTRSRRPDDMPDFEDEYEVGGGHASNPPWNPANYGHDDLFPNGQADRPMGIPPYGAPGQGQGGMIMDPFRQRGSRGSGPQGDKDPSHREPGWIPGSKFDDPYGGHSSIFPGSSGFGGGGFI